MESSMNEHDHRVVSMVAASLSILALATVLIGCAAPPVPASRGPDMPQGTGAVQHEPGFSRFCHDNPGVSTCPQR